MFEGMSISMRLTVRVRIAHSVLRGSKNMSNFIIVIRYRVLIENQYSN